MKNKKLIKIISVLIVVFFSSFYFAGCNPYKEVAKASKGLSEYKINAVLNHDDMTVYAKQKVKFINNTDVILNTVCFNMYARAFREDAKVKPYTSINEAKCFPNGKNYGDISITKVNINNKDANYEIVGDDDNALEVSLDVPLEPDESSDIELEYIVNLAETTHRLGYYKHSITLGNWFPILAVYQKGQYVIEPYYSTGDPFYSELANYEVEFTYDSQYKLCSSGKQNKQVINEDKITASLSARAVRDFAITLTSNDFSVSKTVDDVEVTYVGYENDGNIDKCLDVAIKALSFFNATFGKYPYEKIDIVKAPFLHGGMEYPSLVIVTDSLTEDFDIMKVIVHELAHQWWYGVVGNNEINEAWLDESLAEYSTLLFFEENKEFDVSYEELVSEAFASYVLYADIVSTTDRKINTSMLLPVYEYAGDYEYSYMIYIKGVLMFDSLRELVGKNKLVSGFKSYYKKYKFKIANTDEFVVSMRKATGKDVEAFFDSWLNGKTIIGII